MKMINMVNEQGQPYWLNFSILFYIYLFLASAIRMGLVKHIIEMWTQNSVIYVLIANIL